MDQVAMEVGLGPGHIVLDEDPALPPQKGAQHRPHFSAMSIMAKRLRIPLGTEVGLGAGDIVLDGDTTERGTVHLCGFRHISTSGLGVGASGASFIAVFANLLHQIL